MQNDAKWQKTTLKYVNRLHFTMRWFCMLHFRLLTLLMVVRKIRDRFIRGAAKKRDNLGMLLGNRKNQNQIHSSVQLTSSLCLLEV